MDDELLGRVATLDPVDERDLPDTSSVGAQALLARITVDATTQRTPRRSMRTRVLVPAAALLLLGAVWVLVSPAELEYEVTCFASVSGQPHAEIVFAERGGQDPVEVCRQMWDDRDEPTPESDDLVACTTEASTIAVVPRETSDQCAAMGWMPFDQDSMRPEVAAVSVDIWEINRSQPWMDEQRASALAEEILADAGLDDWTISGPEDAAVGPALPCIKMGLDPSNNSLRLVPVQEPLSPASPGDQD